MAETEILYFFLPSVRKNVRCSEWNDTVVDKASVTRLVQLQYQLVLDVGYGFAPEDVFHGEMDA